MKNSIDEDHGGFFNNLDRDGIVYDTTKQMWLQGRQIWNLCRLYNTLDEFKREDILKAAECGVDFVRKHGPVEGEGRIYFAVTQDGKVSVHAVSCFVHPLLLLVASLLFTASTGIPLSCLCFLTSLVSCKEKYLLKHSTLWLFQNSQLP
eukprot:m.20503 g.20503  ORF g.20503 m.20503 type:complete len:149 (-) comp5255_c0_seq4:1216-1662(-)